MAKTKSEPTAAETKLLDLRQKLEVAKKNDEAKKSDATKKAVADAENAVKDQMKIVNRERFIRVAGGRVKKARATIRNLANVAAPRTYQYDESDVAKAEAALNGEVKKTIEKMRSALTRGASAPKAEDDFSF